MNHFQEEQFLDAYYSNPAAGFAEHLSTCSDCRARFESLQELLETVRESPIPPRGPAYGSELWERISPHLPSTSPRYFWLRWWTLVPAFAVLLAFAFLAGLWTQHRRDLEESQKIRERVLLIAMSDHLERSQIVLAELLHANLDQPYGGLLDVADERSRARNLLEENRLLRQTAAQLGNASDAVLLDDLGRVLLDLANGPASLSTSDLELLRHRIQDQDLLWKVRIASVDARDQGQKL